MKNVSRRIISGIILLVLMICFACPVMAGTGSFDYNSTKAVEYADAHWNDGVGLCAAFVARCLNAGGINLMQKGFGYVDTLTSRLKSKDYVTVNTLTYNKAYKDDSVIAVGDPIAYYCTTCKKGLHIVICTKKTSAGKIQFSAHNAARHNKALYAPTASNCAHKSGHKIVIYGYHINKAVKTTKITLSQTTADAKYLSKDKLQLTATVSPANATNKNIIWSSSDKNVIVDQNGCVSFSKVANPDLTEVKITATPADGGAASAVCTVKLHKVPLSDLDIYLEKTLATYTGKEFKPTLVIEKDGSVGWNIDIFFDVKYDKGRINPGAYAVRVKGKNAFEGEKTLVYRIRGSKMAISSLTPLSKGFKAKWSAKTKNTGYQLQYSTSSTFAASKTKLVWIKNSKTSSKTVTKLKAKQKYYARIRSYKVTYIDGKRYSVYSVWSNKKSVKTK